MRVANGWGAQGPAGGYTLLDATGGFRLERWGDVLLQRPDPQVIWSSRRSSPEWDRVDAVYHRSDKGGGAWERHRKFPDKWTIGYGGLRFAVSPTGFKHTGLFPEQAVNWDEYRRLIEGAGRPLKILNLFAYTGGATLACAAAGASLTHVDASKGMVAWARENAAASGLEKAPVRWIVDDCAKYLAREIRRGSRYDAIILDPPSYGRGPGGEIWKLEDALYPLLAQAVEALTDDPVFFTLNSYTTGLAPGVLTYMLRELLGARFGGQVAAGEIGLPVAATGGVLPCGATGWWTAEGLSP